MGVFSNIFSYLRSTIRQLVNRRHTAGTSTMIGTVLNYVSLRLLGVDSDVIAMAEARGWIQDHGSCTSFVSAFLSPCTWVTER